MDKIMLSSEDIEFILKWRDEHKDLVRLGMSPLRAVKIVCFETGYTITAIRDNSVLTCGINQNGKSLGKLVFTVGLFGQCGLVKNTTKLNREDCQAVLTVYSSTMALLVFGRTTITSSESVLRDKPPQKSTKARKTAKRNGYTYILSGGKKEPKLTVKGSHGSPSGTFSVRGHYRHYKSGKVVWIEEYMKGDGKKKDKTYMIGGKRHERKIELD